MTRFIFTLLVGAAILISTPAFGEEFECIRCYSGAYTILHKNRELSPIMMSFEENGIFMSKSENKLLASGGFPVCFD